MNDKDSRSAGSMKQVLILGGGIAGLSAALALEKRGAFVHLVDKGERLGGKALDWACMATDECQNCGACLSGEMVDQVEHLENALLAVAKKHHRFHLNHSASPPEYPADSSRWSLFNRGVFVAISYF